MNFDHRSAQIRGHLDLPRLGGDEQRHPYAGIVQLCDEGRQARCAGRPRRGRPRWSVLRGARAPGRPHAAWSQVPSPASPSVAAISKFSGFEISAFNRAMSSSRMWRRSSRRCAVMPSAPASIAGKSRAHRIGIAAGPRVAQGGDVIDIDSETQRERCGTLASELTEAVSARMIARHFERKRLVTMTHPLTRSTRATTALARNWAIIALRCLRS